VGAVAFVTAPDDVESMVRVADALMYEVKSRGKNAIRLVVQT
jgi:PleD family two-component response regulator